MLREEGAEYTELMCPPNGDQFPTICGMQTASPHVRVKPDATWLGGRDQDQHFLREISGVFDAVSYRTLYALHQTFW